VGHTPGVLDDSVADITVMLVLMTMRRVEEGIQIIKAGEVSHTLCHWIQTTHDASAKSQWPTLPWGPFVMTGPSIGHPNLTFGFLGFGRISQETVKRLLAFANKSQPPTIIYNSSRARPNQQEIDAEYTKKFGVTVQRVEKDELAARSDVLIVLCVQNESTINLVNKDFLRKMKKSAVLINSARVSWTRWTAYTRPRKG
jgi:glyoxylate/hydroxypyruvate reductase